jgi:hypothetical protein
MHKQLLMLALVDMLQVTEERPKINKYPIDKETY